jgi:CRP/FNR family transcriptional regulator
MEFLSGIPLFDGLPLSDLKALKAISTGKKYNKDEIIFSEGDPGRGFYVIEAGMVKIYKSSLEGKEKILHIFGPREPFGEVAVFTGKPFPANARAIAPCRLHYFPRKEFVRLVAENPSLGLNMLAVLSMRLRQFAFQIEHLSLKETPARLAAYLLYLAEEQKNPQKVVLSITKGQLASLLGTSPETLSRVFSRMSKAGLIEISGRRVSLKNPDGLLSLSEGAMSLESLSSAGPARPR